MSVYTVGHGTRTAEELLDMLQGAQVETLVDVRRAGTVRVRARFSARGALRREPRCAIPPAESVPASAVNPPVRGR